MDFVIRRHSEQIDNGCNDNRNLDSNQDYRKWEWRHLRSQCKNLGLEHFYKTYVQRLQRSYLSIFFVMHTVIGIVHTVVLVATQKENELISPEVYCYLSSILIVWISLTFSFKEDLIQRYPSVPYVASSIAIIGLVTTDVLVPLYHAVVTRIRPPLRPAYASYNLFICYIFLPIADNMHCTILGMATTLGYLIEMILITHRYDQQIVIRTLSELIFLFCVNFFGIYVRLMNEVAIRRAFLDRRECVEGNVLLRFARDQEKNLLLSMLPAHTAGALEEAIRDMITKIRLQKAQEKLLELNANLDIAMDHNYSGVKKWRGQPINKLYVEVYNDVTVLYADVVNYTYMTTQLPVKTLVETLHELFVKFDQASEEFNVLRIKFLGDCYYCVSGVPEENQYHAKSCVDLGLRMIRDIRDVRAQRNLNIDMRIGVHSGSIIAGVIGACKWQYDIWSKDASIANRMESTGVPGKVHLTKQTLDMLDDQYIYEDGTEKARNDPLLIRNNIETFLISPQFFGETNYFIPDDTSSRRFSSGVRKLLTRNGRLSVKPKQNVGKLSAGRNFMQNSMEQYMRIIKETYTEMGKELDRMPIGKFHFNRIFDLKRRRLTDEMLERQSFRSNVSTIFLLFKNKNWEWPYLREPDLMLKYSTFMGLLVFFSILSIQALNSPIGSIYWIVNGVSAIVLISFIPITWFKKLWIICRPMVNEDDPGTVIPPENPFLMYLYRASRNIMENVIARTTIYLLTILFLVICSLIHLVECTPDVFGAGDMLADLQDSQHSPCLNPWSTTQSLILAICISFLFGRIHYLLKFYVGFSIVCFYSWIVFFKYYFIYELSSSINASLNPAIAHLLIITVISILFHLIDRQTEYISRVDYTWKQQLQKKQLEAECTKDTIKILVQNILPAHVAEIYMSRLIKDELYYEEYDNVAIMFATITNYDLQNSANNLPAIDREKNILSILNGIICDFDRQILDRNGTIKIEKIKVAGWTYMVACGLDPGRGDSSSASMKGYRGISLQRSSLLSNGRRSWNTIKAYNSLQRRQHSSTTASDLSIHSFRTDRTKKQSRKSQNVVYVMAEFALNIMQTLKNFNEENFGSNCQLRIGISHGKVMAGVVGSSKPLYDVWGNPVNMASRMDSTGIPGKIQTTQETAEVLQSFGIKCDYRGETNVKGRGLIPTYFIGIDSNLEFIKESYDEVPFPYIYDTRL